MIEPQNDMTVADETTPPPTDQETNAEGAPAPENMVPVPDEMAGTLNEGDTVTGTVVKQGDALFIQIEPPTEKPGYTGLEPEDKELNSAEAMDKYLAGSKESPATQ